MYEDLSHSKTKGSGLFKRRFNWNVFWFNSAPCWQQQKRLTIKNKCVNTSQRGLLLRHYCVKKLSCDGSKRTPPRLTPLIWSGRGRSHSQSGRQQHQDPDWLLGGYHRHPAGDHSDHPVEAGLAEDAGEGERSALCNLPALISWTFC